MSARVAELEAMNGELALGVHELSQRLAAAEKDRHDYEQRWLAECRAHGETRRQLAEVTDEPACTCDQYGACLCPTCEAKAEEQPHGF